MRGRIGAVTAAVFLVLAAPATVTAAGAAGVSALATERAEFYRDVRAKRYDAAVAVGARVLRAAPGDDRFALDYSYALLDAHRRDAAMALLNRLSNSRDATVRLAARRQIAAVAPPAATAATPQTPVPSASAPPFTNAYELLAGGDIGSARDAFVTTLQSHPDDAAAWHQLSYIQFVLKDVPGQIDALDHYIALRPDDDKAKLERAYALLGQGRRAPATSALQELTHSADAEVAAAATKQLATGTGTGGPPPRLDAFGYAENESRFHDTFYGLDARYALAVTRIEPYVAVHFSDDAKSSSVPATSILNDNVLIYSLGVRTKIGSSAYVFIEGGQAQSLLTGHAQSDLRYGALYSQRLGAGGRRSQTQIDASVTHFSRYLDTIAYGNVAHDFFIGSRVVRGLVGANVALDTSRLFYNNAVEGFGGVQIRSGVFTLRLEAVAGTYLGRGIDAPVSTYTSIRPVLLFGYQH